MTYLFVHGGAADAPAQPQQLPGWIFVQGLALFSSSWGGFDDEGFLEEPLNGLALTDVAAIAAAAGEACAAAEVRRLGFLEHFPSLQPSCHTILCMHTPPSSMGMNLPTEGQHLNHTTCCHRVCSLFH